MRQRESAGRMIRRLSPQSKQLVEGQPGSLPLLPDVFRHRVRKIGQRFNLQCSLHNRGPYPYATPNDIAILRAWYADHFPQMLQL